MKRFGNDIMVKVYVVTYESDGCFDESVTVIDSIWENEV